MSATEGVQKTAAVKSLQQQSFKFKSNSKALNRQQILPTDAVVIDLETYDFKTVEMSLPEVKRADGQVGKKSVEIL